MALSVQRLGEHIEHALGAAGQFEPVEVVNLAGEAWVNAHPWAYLERRTKTVSTVADQSYVDVGNEVRNVIAMYPTDSLTNHLRWSTVGEILLRRTSITGSYSGYWAALAFRKDATTGDLHQTAELWPTPSTTGTDYFTLAYRSGWLKVTSDNDKVDLPSWLDGVFVQWVRAYAHGLEDEDLGATEQRLQVIRSSQMFLDAQIRDGAMQPELGEIRGGMAAPDGGGFGHTYVVDSVASPS